MLRKMVSIGVLLILVSIWILVFVPYFEWWSAGVTRDMVFPCSGDLLQETVGEFADGGVLGGKWR